MELENFKYDKVNTSNKEENEEEVENTSISYLDLYKFSTRSDKILLLIASFLCVVSGVSEALFSIAFGKGVGTIANFGAELSNAVNETERLKVEEIFLKKAKDFAIFTGCNGIIIGVSFYVGSSLFNYTATRQTFKIRELYFYRVLNQDIAWHDRSSTGDFASRITDDLRKIQDGMNDKASFTIFHISVIATSVIQSLIFGWKLTLACLAPFPISFFAMTCIGKLSTQLAQDEAEACGEAGKVADETLTLIKTVVAFNGQKEEAKRYDKLLLVAMKNNIKRYLFVGLTAAVTNFFIYFCVAISVWYGARLILKSRAGDGDYTIEKLVTIFNATLSATFYVGATTPYFATFNAAKGAAHKIFSVIQGEPSINQSYRSGIKINKIKGNIRFQNVTFSYPARKQVEVLKNFNLDIKSGETLALVGSSGCGKSTIIQLIQRFYDPSSGNIFIDDNKIDSLNLFILRNQIGTVGQEAVLFDGTISENIRLGNLDATQSEVEEAAKKSNAHGFILSFPAGYQTVIGERGTQLSGGQKQRIAIARALVKKPSILLLDEATSSLDSTSESLVQETLEKVSKDCTTVIVGHRISTVRKADRIVVLDEGTVVEEGSHGDLMALQGIYYNLVIKQLSKNEEEEEEFGVQLLRQRRKLSDQEALSHALSPKNSILKEKLEEDSKAVDLNFRAAKQILMAHLSPKWCMVLGVFFSILIASSMITSSLVLAKSLAVISLKDPQSVLSQTNKYFSCILLIGLVVAVANVFQSYLIGISGEHLTMSLRSSMFKCILHQEMGWFDQTANGVGSLGARLAGEPSSVQNAISLCSGPFLNAITMAILLLCVGFYLSWKLLLGYFAFLPFLIILMYTEQKILVEENRKNTVVLEQSTKLAVEAITNVRTIASLAMEKYFHHQYVAILEVNKTLTIRNIHIQGLVYGLARSSLAVSYIIAFYYGAHVIKSNQAGAVAVIGLSQIFIISMSILMTTVAFLPNLTKGFVACNQINSLLSRIPKIKCSDEKQLDQIEGDVEYKGVTFSYPTRPDVTILDGLDISVLKGKTVALVGPSGCGKSTIVQLLERFYDSSSGQVTFGEEDISRLNLSSLRLRLGIVMQEPNLFSRTIEENIGYGKIESVVSREEVVDAARTANIHNFISTLPLGYYTMLGEKGTQLSGGQKQRIAIARALLRNPEILLLDEATSALDAENEKVVQEALNRAKRDRTCIVIAHRLKIIVDSDVIVVINEGKIAEKGNHQELMNMKGLYWKLYTKQHQA